MMSHGNSRITGATLSEVLCVVLIIAALAALIAPAISSAKERAKITRSHSNMRQIHLALTLYCDQANGSLHDLPPHASLSRLLQLPSEVFHTGGRPMSKATPNSDVYRMMWPGAMTNEAYNGRWEQYVVATDGNPVLIIDDTFPGTAEVGPFIRSSHYGLFWSGSVVQRRYFGSGQDLMNNWR